MRVLYGIENVVPTWSASTVSIGVFDGVHRGHQAVISRAVEEARARSHPSLVLTFDRHPDVVLRPQRAPRLLLPLDLRLERMAVLGVSVVVVAGFTKDFAQMDPEEFFSRVLVGALRAETVVVGPDFRFGRARSGDVEWLASRVRTVVVPYEEALGEKISSTRIRSLVAEGNVKEAGELLGYPYTLAGLVVPGCGRGKALEVPTVNLGLLAPQVVPVSGVYAGFGVLRSGRYLAGISVGDRPTFEEAGFALEAHLLDYEGPDLYGQDVVLEFVERLREQRVFSSSEELRAMMREDLEKVRALLGVRHAR
jgi:riboflavin kinase/FMN adenylyltransferase